MKLYTEEQVREMLEDINNLTDEGIFYYMNNMTPIELPSDEEIEEQLELYASEDWLMGKRTGMFFVINYIKEQGNGENITKD